MHTPVRTARETCAGTPASPAAGAATASAAATRASSPTYSSELWPAAGWGGGGATARVGAPAETSPPGRGGPGERQRRLGREVGGRPGPRLPAEPLHETCCCSTRGGAKRAAAIGLHLACCGSTRG